MQTLRGYITKAEVEKYCDIALTDETEAIERMEYAEQIIDDYVGHQVKFFRHDESGVATGGSTTTLEDTSNGSALNTSYDDKYTYCTLQILSGALKGEERLITSHEDNTVTLHEAFDTPVVGGTVYRVYQTGKFPRVQDFDLVEAQTKYFKYIPTKVKDACLAQFQYMLEMGDEFFTSGVEKTKERIGDYSFEVKGSRMIAPKAKLLLKGITNRKGNLVGTHYGTQRHC